MADPLAFRRRHIGRALARSFWLFEDQVNAGIRARGFPDFRAADATVIRCLPGGVGARITELAERARMTKQGMSKSVRSLEERGYLRRVDDPDDARAQRVQLTARGVQLLEAAESVIADLEAEWTHVVGEDALRQVRTTLIKLADALVGEDYI